MPIASGRRLRPLARLLGCSALAVPVALLLLVADQPATAPATVDDPTALVDPFIGTEDLGNTFPGAAVPFGMVQLSPDNGGQAGYDHDNTRIDGFSHTHLSGVGCRALGEVPLMPTTGRIERTDPAGYGSAYSRDSEVARPGYYAVDLERYGVRAELTATLRTGWHRYTFAAATQANVLVAAGRATMPVRASKVRVAGDRAVEGWVDAGGFCGAHDHHRLFFSAQFDRPFNGYGTWAGNRRSPAARTTAGGGPGGAWVSFDTTTERTVGVAVGLSYTGVRGARRNLAAETPAGGFDVVATAAHDRWAAALDAVRVTGGTDDQRRSFTTALYHALLHPNIAGDIDGTYRGADERIHHARSYTPMANFSLWDTFRPQNQLLELLVPDVARDVARSVLATARQGRWLPRWSLSGAETNIMTGDPVTPFLVENWSKGLLAGHESEAYRALRRNALSQPPPGLPFNGRNGNRWYRKLGYVPAGVSCPHRGGDSDCRRPASATLEYAAADAALAVMARALGHRADARLLVRRGQNYRRLWDRRLRGFRPRTASGEWMAPYDPATGSGQFHEGGASQYGWLVPQDPAGLVGLLGGRRAATRRLDAFFDYAGLLRDPARTVRRRWVTDAYHYYGAQTYNPNNEPDLHAPFLYAWTGRPWRTATVVRAAWRLFTADPAGLTGNDDLGTMSAWYVLSSLGLYPTTSGAGFYVLTTPQFPRAIVRLGAVRGRQGGTLEIDAPGAETAPYVAYARLHGRPLGRAWVRHAEIARGGRLTYVLSRDPTRWATAPAAAPPSASS